MENSALEKLKSMLNDDPATGQTYDDDSLLDALKEHKMDTNKTAKTLQSQADDRRKWDVDNVYEKWMIPDVLKTYVPMVYSGHTKDGSPLVFCPYGLFDFRGIFQCTSMDEYIRYMLYLHEYGRRQAQEQSKKLGKRISQVVAIADMSHLSFHQIFWKLGIEATVKTCHMYESVFHGLYNTIFCINAPRVFTLLWPIMTAALDEQTVGLIKIYGKDSSQWIPDLLNAIDADILPTEFGGSLTPKNDHPLSMIYKDLKIPEHYYQSHKRSSLKMKAGQSTTIQRGNKFTFDIDVLQQDSVLRWEFTTDGGDVAFSLLVNDETLIESERVKSEHSVMNGKIECSKLGKYVFVFDNSHSKLRSKKLTYNINCIPSSAVDGCGSHEEKAGDTDCL